MSEAVGLYELDGTANGKKRYSMKGRLYANDGHFHLFCKSSGRWRITFTSTYFTDTLYTAPASWVSDYPPTTSWCVSKDGEAPPPQIVPVHIQEIDGAF